MSYMSSIYVLWNYEISSAVHKHRIGNDREATRVGIYEVCNTARVALFMFIMQVLASQLHFLANRNAGLDVPPFIRASKLRKIRSTYCTVEWPF